MREILFKAKRIDNGEWVYGYLNGFCYIESERYIKTGYNEQHKIDPETICQYTGLKDEHGNKIWENDIVKHCAENKLALVEFIDGQFSIQKYGYWLPSSDNFKVIGNKFDNPELLTKEVKI